MAKTPITELNIEVPTAYQFLFRPARYKVSYGGRGAGRTWSYARYMLMRALQSKVLILCCREIQVSIRESVHRTLADQIERLGLSSYFDIQERTIVCLTTGSQFIFTGLYRNVNKIKSYEGIDICDVEEAESVSAESWQTLLPTIRRPGSEVLVRMNTKYADDDTYVRFIANPPTGAVVRKTSYRDNPYFTDVLEQERLADQAYRPQEYRNIWEGEPIGTGRKVYPLFDRLVHVHDYDMSVITKRTDARYYCSCDPAQHYYPAILWCAVWPHDGGGLTKWVYNEWPRREDVGDDFHAIRKKLLYTGTLSDLSKIILVNDMTLTYGNKIRRRAIDTRFAKGAGSGSFFSGDTQGLVSEWAKPSNGGLVWHCPYEATIDVQRSNITGDLQYNTTIERGPFNEPSLYISPRCTNLITSLTNHRLQEDSEAQDEKYKDFADALSIMYASINSDTGHASVKQPEGNLITGHIPAYRVRQNETSWMGA